uniref:RRM domain-containing protein n=1 Tax=Elphidium margaritaceum TaxID=933848 RepID=A0A7S0XNF3_9EUKA
MLAHSFDVNVVDINDENALNQILYSQKHKLQKDAESMVLADLISTAMQQQQTVRKQKQKIRVDDKSDDKCPHHYYVQISGLSDVRFEAEVIDLCAMYDIYPNELIFKRNSAVVGVNDADIMSKIYQMDESFFRCSLLSVSLLQGNAYDTNKLSSTLPTNTLYVTGFDLIEDVENKLLTIFSKYGKLRKKTLIVKTNKSEQNFTFVEYVYIKDAIHAYNDIHANKHQQRLKLNTNAKSNRKIFVRFAKTFNFGGKLGGAGFRPPSMLHNRGGVAKNGALRNGAKANDAQKANKEEDKKEQIYVEDMYVHPLQQSVPRQLTAYEHVSYNSALCLIPPKEVWPGIQALRSKYDPDYLLYMPQITIFWPFMDETYFAEIASLIKREIIDKIKFEAFDVTLQNFDMSEGMKNHVYGNRTHKDMYVDNIFLQPDQKACNRMVYLYKHLANIWYDLGRSREYQPHLVVGKFQSRDLLYYKMQFNANYKPISWTCDALYLISRTPETQAQFSIKSRIPFYSGGAAK